MAKEDKPKQPVPPTLQVQGIYPEQNKTAIEGLYLSQDLRSRIPAEGAFVYSNFIASLDGRIAISSKKTEELTIPQDTANSRDWRLLLELAAPADAIIVSGRYMRQLGDGTAQAQPPLEGDVPADIMAFRQQLGLPLQPALVIVSNSLALPTSLFERLRHRAVIVATSEQSDAVTAKSLTEAGIDVIRVGQSSVDGSLLVNALQQRGLKLIYSIAGPAVLHTLLDAGVLKRLYLTTVLRLLSGTDYATMASGEQLSPAYDFKLAALYIDPQGPDGVQQLLQVFDHHN